MCAAVCAADQSPRQAKAKKDAAKAAEKAEKDAKKAKKDAEKKKEKEEKEKQRYIEKGPYVFRRLPLLYVCVFVSLSFCFCVCLRLSVSLCLSLLYHGVEVETVVHRIKPKSVQMIFKAEKNLELKKNKPDLDADEVASFSLSH